MKAREAMTFEELRSATRAGRTSAITALLGPNGAGKTTTLRMISTLVKPDSGTAMVGDADVVRDERKVRAELGVLSDARGL